MTPTVYMSNWSSHKTPGHHGNGKKYGIMAKPRWWEHGDGVVRQLIPSTYMLEGIRSGRISVDHYRNGYMDRGIVRMAPGELMAGTLNNVALWKVSDGDTLCCSCSRADAAKWLCHRTWAAVLLREAGWNVVLDGVSIDELKVPF